MIFTAACCFRTNADDSLEINKDTGLHTLPTVVVSNQTTHEHNIAFARNNKVIQIIKRYVPSLKPVYFWSDGCFKLVSGN